MNVDYFIKKFEAIPEEKWCINAYEYEGRCCVLGHCGFRTTLDDIQVQAPEGIALTELFRENGLPVTAVNDGTHPAYQQITPKARILGALRDIEAR